MPKLPEILDKEGFKHIDEAVANYNIACVTLKEIMNKIKDVSLNKEQARMRVKELDIELSGLDIEKSRVYSLKLELGEKLLKAAEG
jgi:PIN domain nuclease of toxin-antitoxin system